MLSAIPAAGVELGALGLPPAQFGQAAAPAGICDPQLGQKAMGFSFTGFALHRRDLRDTSFAVRLRYRREARYQKRRAMRNDSPSLSGEDLKRAEPNPAKR